MRDGRLHLVVVRHTPVAVPDGTCYGRLDVPLSPDWPAHFAALQAKLPWQPARTDPVLTSPSQRCLRFASYLDGSLRVDARLREFDFGDWEGKAWADIPRAALDAWASRLGDGRPPGGESLTDVAARVRRVVRETRRAGHRRVVLVTHGGVVRALLAEFLGLPLAHAARLHVDHGSVSEVHYDGAQRQLLCMNR